MTKTKSDECWKQLVMQIIAEIIQENRDVELDLKEMERYFLEDKDPETVLGYKELQVQLDYHTRQYLQSVYERGFLDGLKLAHAAF